jgi:acyl-CoA synthetase (AMP-forming)/AMP-acid ligase II/thioesterase domain-containing protein
LVRDAAESHPDNIALLAPGRKGLTFHGLAAQVKEIAAQLRFRGIGPNDRVAVVLPNTPEMAAAFLGIACVATCAPLNPAYSAEELEFYLTDLRARAVVVEAGAKSPVLRVAVARGVEILGIHPQLDAEAGRFSVLHALHEPGVPPRWAGPEHVALVLHTSGTTGKPKMVPLRHANLCASARNIANSLALCPSDRALGILPLFHIQGLVGTHLSSLAAGASVACCPGFYVTEFFDWLDECRPTWYTAVPTMHQLILARAGGHREEIARCPFRFLRSASAPLPPQVMQELEQVFGVPVIEAYGMTEAASQIASNPLPPGQRRPGTVGRAAGPRVAIMDAAGRLLPAGQVGEVVVQGPTVMKGFENDAEANRTAFVNGWLRTGDAGTLDADGYLTITGRLKEMINRGGEKIAPREIEEVVLAHPAIDQVVAFAVSHASLGEDVCAAVVLRPGARVTELELREFVAGRLAHFKVPSRIVFVGEIPKGRTGKVQRIGLAQVLGVTKTSVAPAPRARSQTAAPRTELEHTLERVWAEVLGVDRVDIDQNFLELGGDSMLAGRLVARVNALLGLNLTFVALFTTPTVAGMAETITRASAAEPSATGVDLAPDTLVHEERPERGSTLVVLRSDGAMPPFFCVPGMNVEGSVVFGDELRLVRLARLLDPDQGFCSFRLEAPATVEPASSQVEAFAQRFLRDLRSHQRGRPYFLGGYSFGGLVSLEMARQLQAEGEQVGILVMIDSAGPYYPRERPWLERLGVHVSHMQKLPIKEQIVYPLSKVRAKIKPDATGFSGGRRGANGGPAIVQQLKRAGAAYTSNLRPYRGRLILLRATEHFDNPGYCFDDPTNGWNGFFQSGVEVHPIRGNHHTMFDEPGVTELATALQASLRKAYAALSG